MKRTLKFLQLSFLCMASICFGVDANELVSPLDKSDIKEMTELEKQQEILKKYKPLIKKRTYNDRVVYGEDFSPVKLNRLPALSEGIYPGKAPNIRLIPYLLKSFAHPAYIAEFEGVRYNIAVSCQPPVGFDDCSTVSLNKFKQQMVYVKFIETNDKNFSRFPKMRIGYSYASLKHLFSADAKVRGGGECLQIDKVWAACFDANFLAVGKGSLQMKPMAKSRLKRFLKISGQGY